ncbi:MAG: hypothetical protein K6T78_12250 [Alicyclobacillus sp.]|nr:hypothetical protein [Alicyclobacillus sp.]
MTVGSMTTGYSAACIQSHGQSMYSVTVSSVPNTSRYCPTVVLPASSVMVM